MNPSAEIGGCPKTSPRSGPATHSFDDLIGAHQDRLRHGEAECLCGREIDHQLEPCGLLDRQIGRLGTAEDLSGINSDLAISRGEAGSIADQATGGDEFTLCIDRRNGMA